MLTKRQVLRTFALSVLTFFLFTVYGFLVYDPKVDNICNRLAEVLGLSSIAVMFYMTMICVFSFVFSATFRQSRTVRDQYVREPVIKLMVWREVLSVGPKETRGDT